MEVDQRKLGVDLFNYVWTLLDKKDRTPEEAELMVHAAHASAWHWRQVGAARHFARSEWQISRVYATLGRMESALHHAERSLEICEKNKIGDFDLAFAYEALARASTGDEREAWTAKAAVAGEAIAEREDRDWFFQQLATLG